VVDHQLGRHEWVDLLRVPAKLGHRVSHRRKIDNAGDAGEVLHQDSCGAEGDLLSGLGLGVPTRDRLDVASVDGAVAFRAQQVLKQDLQRVRQTVDVEALLQCVEPEDLEAPLADFQLGAGSKAID